MFELVAKDYPAQEMYAMKGIHFAVYIEEDLRKIAIAEGYPIRTSADEEVGLNWDECLYFTCNLQARSDEDPIYRATLNSRRELIKAG